MRSERRNTNQSGAKDKLARGRFDRWHGLLFLLGIGVTLLAGAIVWRIGLVAVHANPARIQAQPLRLPNAEAPWGQLEYTIIRLERPDESMAESSATVPPTQWFFDHSTESDLQALFSAGDLTAEQSRQLLNKSHWQALSNGWLVLPPQDLVIDLSYAARRRIYEVLRKSPQNLLHYHPFRLPEPEFNPWLSRTGLPKDKVDLIQKLSYLDDQSICLSDFEIIESRCTLAERKRFAKAISENPALLMTLRVTPDTDIDALMRYWGRGRRLKSMKPFLESLARVPEGTSVGVSVFFPEFARVRLYTYPDPESDPTALREDCFWTSMNFLNDVPDARFFNADEVLRTIKSDYEEVKTNWAFGDVIVVLENGISAKHMCVYVADDVVFTKNGVDSLEPWLLMKMPQMLARYTGDAPIQVAAYRRKMK